MLATHLICVRVCVKLNLANIMLTKTCKFHLKQSFVSASACEDTLNYAASALFGIWSKI